MCQQKNNDTPIIKNNFHRYTNKLNQQKHPADEYN